MEITIEQMLEWLKTWEPVAYGKKVKEAIRARLTEFDALRKERDAMHEELHKALARLAEEQDVIDRLTIPSPGD